MQTITFRAMGSQILIAIDTDDPGMLNHAWVAREWFGGWEQALSRFIITSELYSLNRVAGKPFRVSDTMMEVLTLALSVQEKTEGLVTPLILNALEFAGYNVTFEELIQNMDQILRQPFQPHTVTGTKLQLDDEKNEVTVPLGYRIDLGGVAKGWAAHQTMLRLQHLAPILVDAGGDIAISGPQKSGSAWPVGISNPFTPTEDVELLMLSGGGVATSGRDYRRWKVADTWMHHIIDPRSSAPAETDIISATILASDVMIAEAAAKAAIILGSVKATQWLSKFSDYEFVLILENGNLLHSQGLLNYIWNKTWPQFQINKSL